MEFNLPDPGEGLLEAEIVSWRVAVGEVVAVNDIIVEIETAKSLVELPSPAAGTVEALLVGEGDIVEVGSPIIRIAEGAERDKVASGAAAPAVSAAQPAAPGGNVPEPAPTVTGQVQDAAAPADEPPTAMLVGYGAKPGGVTRRSRKRAAEVLLPQTDQVDDSYRTDRPVSRRVDEVTPAAPVTAEPSGETLPRPGQPTGSGEVPRPPLAKPPVRRIARDLGVDLADVTGTGPGGLITAADVIAAASPQGPSAEGGARCSAP
jgi:pyruvate dehydrogenase E2 component (dihydrolipoamide acetyltransferase)